MSRKHSAASVAASAVFMVLLTFVIAACGTGGSGGNAASGLATSKAVTAAKNQVTTCVRKTGPTKLLQASGRSQFVTCMEGLVPPAKQAQFKTCITNAFESDRLWTTGGRSKFTNQSLPSCLNAAA